jgi:hypothetical protein
MQNSETTNAKSESESDIVWGAADIGKVVNLPPRKAFYSLEKGYPPGRKVGRIWISTRKALLAACDPTEAA